MNEEKRNAEKCWYLHSKLTFRYCWLCELVT